MPVWTATRRLDDAGGERRAGPLAEPHAEIEERRLAEPFEHRAVRRLGRAVREQAMVDRVRPHAHAGSPRRRS